MAKLIGLKTLSYDVNSVGVANLAFQNDFPVGKKDDVVIHNGNGLKTGKLSPHAQNIPQKTKGNIRKNLITISFGFLFLFTAFSAIANIQSSLNSDEGLGQASLSVIYGALVLSCMFLPSFIIQRLGCKWTLVVATLMYSTYMAANFYPHWGTLIPTSIIVGLAAAPLWSAKCTYLTQIGGEYATLVGETSEVIIVRFFGFFFMVFQSGQITGNLISSLVLKPGGNDNSTIDDYQLAICGSAYCNEPLPYLNQTNSTSTDNSGVSDDQLYMLCGIYLGCAIFSAILISVIVDPLVRNTDGEQDSKPTGIMLLVATFRHMKDPKQILLIPLTIYSGIEQAFMTGDFTKALVTCSLGIHNVGFVMICYGVVDAICSISFSPVVKKVGRAPVYIFGALLNVGVAITILTWKPNPDEPVIFFVLSGLWGMADAIWQTQINAFYGVIFTNNEEAAFSNYRLWESLGFIIAYAYSNFLCVHIKLYILLAILAAGMTGYLSIEFYIRKKNSS